MIIKHLTDDELQQYAFDKTGCDDAVLQHIAFCEHCKKEAVDVRLLFEEIKKLPKPVSDYDQSALVLARLPATTAKLAKDVLLYVTVLAAFVLLVLPVCVFWPQFAKMAIGVLPVIMCPAIAGAITIVLAGCINQFRNYKRKVATISTYAGLL
jgi:hypothetical protein